MYCSKCGKPVSDDANYCSFCGAKIAGTDSFELPSAAMNSPREYESLAEKTRKGTLVYLRDVLSMEFSVHKLEQTLGAESNDMIVHDYWFFWKEYWLSPPINRGWPRPDERMVLSYYPRLNQYFYAFLEGGDSIDFYDCNGNRVYHQYGRPCYSARQLTPDIRKKLMTLPQIKKRLFSDPDIKNSKDLYWENHIIRDNGYMIEPFAQIKTIIEDFENSVSLWESEYQARLPAMKSRIAELEQELAKAKEIRQKLYDVNVIPAKYRNIGCAYFIYEFYSTSNIPLSNVFLHLDLDKIQEQLTTLIQNQQQSILQQAIIIAQNEKIMEQNERLFQELSQIHADSGRISAQLNEIRENNIETTQWTKIAACNAEACAWIGLANYLK